MSFDRIRAIGLWIDGSTVAGSEFETFDAHLANAIDGNGGGAYSLQADLTIGGAPGARVRFETDYFDVFGEIAFDGSFTTLGNVTLGESDVNSLLVFASSEFLSPAVFGEFVTFNDDVEFNDPVVFNDDTEFNDTLLINGAIHSYGDAVFNGAAGFYSGATFHDLVFMQAAVQFNAAAAFNATVTTNGVGQFRVRRVQRQTLGIDADMTIDMTLTDHVIVESGTLSAVRNYTISDTGAVNGDRVRFTNYSPTWAILVRNPGGSALESIGWVTGLRRWADFERINGSWRAMPGDTAG